MLYSPSATAALDRRNSGCLTPNNAEKGDRIGTKEVESGLGVHTGKGNSILSPPLSPYVRTGNHGEEDEEAIGDDHYGSGNYTWGSTGCKLDQFRSHRLTINPWKGLDHNYKSRQLRFLKQYSLLFSREEEKKQHRSNLVSRHERRVNAERKRYQSESESDFLGERMTTRRHQKATSELPTSDFDRPETPIPKKKRVKREYTITPSPQQAALIDESIPDYSPDTSTLPDNNRALKVEWKGQPMDLRNDEDYEKLHPSEVLLASTLRLSCKVYLDSKRRLFNEKVNRMRNRMQFRRTDAQKACRIDVNKASRLFAAFEKVGWLDDSHFQKYM